MKEKKTNNQRFKKRKAVKTVFDKLEKTAKGLNKNEEKIAARNLAKKLFSDFTKRKKETEGVCVFDSALMPLPEGVRPAIVDTRKLKYCFDECELTLSLYPVSIENFEVVGQITGVDSETKLSVLFKRGKQSVKADTDTFHLFSLQRLEKGSYSVSIKREKKIIGTVSIII